MNDTTSEGGYARFSPITESDHAGVLWIVAILSLLYSAFATALRIRIKWSLYGIDDLLIALAMVMHLGQAATIFSGLNHGLGKANSITTEDEWTASGKYFLASEILSILTLCCGKCSVVALLLRIFAIDTIRGWTVCLGFLVLNAIWGIGSVIGLAVNCNSRTLLIAGDEDRCPGQLSRWQAITALDITTELIIVVLPIFLVWSLQIAKEMKYQFIFAFSFRLGAVVFSAFHLGYFRSFQESKSNEPQLDVTDTLLFQQAMLTWALVSATIPNLKTFMRSFSTGMGWPVNLDGGTTNPSYPLQTFGSSTGRRTAGRSSSRDMDLASSEARLRALRPDVVQHQTTVIHTDHMSDTTTGDGQSLTRSGSQELIIRKEVQWSVSRS